MDSFTEEFPELNIRVVGTQGGEWIEAGEVEAYCLSKQRVREAIKKAREEGGAGIGGEWVMRRIERYLGL